MRPFQRMLKVIKISAISFSLLPLSTFAECFTPAEQGPIDRFMTSMSIVLQQGDRRDLVQSCMASDLRPYPVGARSEAYVDVPGIPKDFQTACNCLEAQKARPSSEEIKTSHQRLKELKYKDNKLREFSRLKNSAIAALDTYFTLNPKGEIPSVCQSLLGEETKFEGGASCENDIKRIMTVRLKVEPYVLNPDSEEFSNEVRNLNRKNGENNTLVVTEDYLFYNELRHKYVDGEDQNRVMSDNRRQRLIYRAGGEQIFPLVFRGLDANYIESRRQNFVEKLQGTNELLVKVGHPVEPESVVPFSNSEIDRKAVELLLAPIQYSIGFFNNLVAEAEAKGETVLTGTSDFEKINSVVRLLESKTGRTAGVPAEPLVGPFGPEEQNKFVPQNDFDEAVSARYQQIADIFNKTPSLRAALEQIYGFESDGKTLRVQDDLHKNLQMLSAQVFGIVESGEHLEKSCKAALEEKAKICSPMTDSELDQMQLSAKDVNLFAAVDLKKGQEGEYGLLTCGSYLEWKEQEASLFTGPSLAAGFDDYSDAGCDLSAGKVSIFRRGMAWWNGSHVCEPLKEVDEALPVDFAQSDIASKMDYISRTAARGTPPSQNELIVINEGDDSLAKATTSNMKRTPSDYDHMLPATGSSTNVASSEREVFGPFLPPGHSVKKASATLGPDYAIKVDSNVTPSTFGFDSSNNIGESTVKSAASFTGSIDGDDVSSNNSFNMNNLFKPVVSDGGRFSIYDNDLAAIGNTQSAESEIARPMTEAQVAGAQRALSSTDSRYNALLSEFEKLQAEMEELKGAKEEEETAELLGDLKEQIAELKDSRKELEERIKREKAQREQEAKASQLASSNQKRNDVRESIFRRDDSSSSRPAARPTYDANEGATATVARVQAPVSGVQSVTNSGANVSGNSIRRSDDTAARASDMSAGVLGASSPSSSSAAMANVEGLRLTATAFSKLSSNDLQTLYETNKGQPIYVERQLADGDGSHELVIEKYVPEIIEGEVVYSFQGEVGADAAEEALQTPEEKATTPGRAIASVEAPEEIVEAAAPLRTIKEVTNYEETLYSPVHQDLIERIRQAIAEKRQQ